MCFKAPAARPVPQRPTREAINNDAARETARLSRDRQGQYGNIFTSMLGDAGYGASARKPVKLGNSASAGAAA